jgi:hypothetical protein
VTSKRFFHAISLVGFLALNVFSAAGAIPAPADSGTALLMDDVAPRIRLAQAQTPGTPAPDAAAAPDQQGAPEQPIGNVATLTGVATVTRNNTDTPLQLKDDVYLNDIVKTQASSSLSITFNDATTFRLSANAEITIDNYVYEEGGAGNAGTFDIARGTIAFVAAQVAKTGNMEITTPTATLGIRGTTGVVDVPEGVTATSANNVNVKLYPDADGRVGQIQINDRQGARLGALTQGASGFAIRAGAGGARFAAVPIAISPQQQQRDQGFVRQVHSAQTVGRRIVTEQRAFRRANPDRINPNAPRRQPGQQQPGQNRPGQPGQNRPGQQQQQPGTPNNRQENRQGQQQPGRPGQLPRAGQTTQPATPAQPGTARPGQNALPANPAQPGAAPRPGQNALPANPAQPGAPLRPGQNGQPINPAQPGAVPRPGQQQGPQNVQPATPAQPNVQPGAPPLPNGQPILRQGQPQFAPGAPRPGLLNRPALNRPGLPRPARQGPPPKDKKKH